MESFEEYNTQFPENVQEILHKIFDTIQKAAPEAKDKISYGMPSFDFHGKLVYFGAFKNHIGFYALPSTNKFLQNKLDEYKTGKGSIQFQLNSPIPYELIKEIVLLRIEENLKKNNKIKG